MVKGKERKIRIDVVVPVVLLIMWYLMPVARFYVSDVLAAIFGTAVCFLLTFSRRKCFTFALITLLVNAVIALNISLVTYEGSFQAFYSNLIHLQLFFIPAVLLCFFATTSHMPELRLIIKCTVVIIGIVFLSSLNALISNPIAARALASKSASEELIRIWQKNNVGGFNFVYSLGVLMLCVLYKIRNGKTGTKLFMFIFLILLVYYLYTAQYATMIVVSGAVVLAYISIKRMNYFYVLFLCIAAVCIIYFLPELLMLLSRSTSSVILAYRFSDLARFLVDGEMRGSFEARFQVYSQGIKAFLQHPVFGSSYVKYGYSDIWHSTIIELLVKIGIVGTCVYFIQYVRAFRIIKVIACKSAVRKKLVYLSLVFTLLVGLINPIYGNNELALMLWFFMPALMLYEDSLSEQEEEAFQEKGAYSYGKLDYGRPGTADILRPSGRA